MRILLVHNHNQQPGGEDEVFAAEGRLLEANGHEVDRFTVEHDAVNELGKVALAKNTVWNRDIQGELRSRVKRHGAEIVHFHNTFPLISPSAYYAAREEGAAVVQTLHNYRLLCANSMLYRNGAICEECVGKPVATPAIRHGCYRDSRMASAVSATMLTLHSRMGTWHQAVDLYLVPTAFARGKLLRGGLPGTRLMVKPHFVERDPGKGEHGGGYALYVGRVSREKGIRTMYDAWERIGKWMPLKVVGSGPLETLARDGVKGVEWLGWRERGEVFELMKNASILVMPSESYETFGLPIIEAYATGLPVIASRHGALAELVPDGVTGLVFEPGNRTELEAKVVWALRNPEEWAKAGNYARRAYEVKYTAARNHELLMEGYRRALATRVGKASEEPVLA